MEFKGPYLMAMREQAPKMFKRLSRAGRLMAHVDQKAHEASQMFRELTAGKRDQYGDLPLHIRREAEEVVRAALIEFPPEHQPTPDDPLASTRRAHGEAESAVPTCEPATPQA